MSTKSAVTGEIVSEHHAMVPYKATMILSAAEVRNQIDAVREMQRSVLTKDTDYGITPGTDKPALFKPGAELLLKAHGFGHRMDQVDSVPNQGITYRCTVFVTMPDGAEAVQATCDGYAGYDESGFYQTCAQLEQRERMNASKWKRPVKEWKWAEPYKAPWNTLLKMSQKRALVGAALQACAASGLFAVDIDEPAPPPPGADEAMKVLAEAIRSVEPIEESTKLATYLREQYGPSNLMELQQIHAATDIAAGWPETGPFTNVETAPEAPTDALSPPAQIKAHMALVEQVNLAIDAVGVQNKPDLLTYLIEEHGQVENMDAGMLEWALEVAKTWPGAPGADDEG